MVEHREDGNDNSEEQGIILASGLIRWSCDKKFFSGALGLRFNVDIALRKWDLNALFLKRRINFIPDITLDTFYQEGFCCPEKQLEVQ